MSDDENKKPTSEQPDIRDSSKEDQWEEGFHKGEESPFDNKEEKELLPGWDDNVNPDLWEMATNNPFFEVLINNLKTVEEKATMAYYAKYWADKLQPTLDKLVEQMKDKNVRHEMIKLMAEETGNTIKTKKPKG